MKKLYLFIFLIISCSSEETQIIKFEETSNSGKVLTINEINEIGFKKVKEYKIDKLPNSNAAFFGFIKNDIGEPKDYEMRFYDNHDSALKFGEKYAENISGKNGCISKECSLWQEGLKDRIQMHDLGTLHPKYMSYYIYNNLILFCPGYDENEARNNCNFVINKLEK